jgi:uncharacterized protein YqjF (DUF2071 family)
MHESLRHLDHRPWPLAVAAGGVRIQENCLLNAAGIEPLDPHPVCHFSTGVHVISFPPQIAPEGPETHRCA